MLDRTATDQCKRLPSHLRIHQADDDESQITTTNVSITRGSVTQFQSNMKIAGIGTYVVSGGLSNTTMVARFKSWYQKAKDSAIGSSFDHHVVSGYRFLMRYYETGDLIYIFGFSRGAYIARFLAEMLDYVGLLSHGNEEMIHFAWKAFATWQARQGSDTPEGIKEKKEMYAFLKGFRETFSRPIRRIRFLGLFDTVNSVPRFETAWMERSRFPYTARTSAKVIRHAVAIDERRAKFRQDLIYQSDEQRKHNKKQEHNPARQKMHEFHERYRRRHGPGSTVLKPVNQRDERGREQGALGVSGEQTPYRARSHSTHRTRKTEGTAAAHDGHSEVSVAPHPHEDDGESLESVEDEHNQDIDEVWFAGGHADIGGGWEMLEDSKSASHIPLCWMVREAMRAGLHFDPDKIREMGCLDVMDEMDRTEGDEHAGHPNGTKSQNHEDVNPGNGPHGPGIPDIMVRAPSTSTPKLFQGASFQSQNGPRQDGFSPMSEKPADEHTQPMSAFFEMINKCYTARIHDSLSFDCGLSKGSVLAWKVMEYLPFRRLDLQDGEWKPIRWPLPCGEVRDIPRNARVHGSVIRRMQLDESYRPGNLIIGGGGRGVRFAGKEHGTGDWVCVSEEGDPIGEIWVRKDAVEEMQEREQEQEQGRDPAKGQGVNGVNGSGAEKGRS